MVKRTNRGVMWGLLALVLAIGIMGSALAGGSAFAAKGGNAATTTIATLTVTPNPAAAYSTFHGEGCGYVVGKTLNVVVHGGGGTLWVGVDQFGCMSLDWPTAASGSYLIEAFQQLRDHGRHQWVLMASTTLVVQ